jgi:hypothetical protein
VSAGGAGSFGFNDALFDLFHICRVPDQDFLVSFGGFFERDRSSDF